MRVVARPTLPFVCFIPEDSEDKSFEEEAKGLAAWILALTGGLDPGESPFTYYGVRGGDEALSNSMKSPFSCAR